MQLNLNILVIGVMTIIVGFVEGAAAEPVIFGWVWYISCSWRFVLTNGTFQVWDRSGGEADGMLLQTRERRDSLLGTPYPQRRVHRIDDFLFPPSRTEFVTCLVDFSVYTHTLQNT